MVEPSEVTYEVTSFSSFNPSNSNNNAPITAPIESDMSSGEKKNSDNTLVSNEVNKSANGRRRGRAVAVATNIANLPKVPKVPKVKHLMCVCKHSILDELFVNQKSGIIRCQYAMSNMITQYTDMCTKCDVVPHGTSFIPINSLIEFGNLQHLDSCFQKEEQEECANTGCDKKIKKYAFCLRNNKSFFCIECSINALNKMGVLKEKAKIHTSTKIPMTNFASEFEQFVSRFEKPPAEMLMILESMKLLANGISNAVEKKKQIKASKSNQNNEEKSQG